MAENFYITTPIFYPTGLPHIGTAYNIFVADTLARYYRRKLGGENVLFLTGLDEHGGNIAKKAEENNQTAQEYVDYFASEFQQVWEQLHITNSDFIRTTNPEHKQFAADIIQKAYDNGDLYEGKYEGWYCESCEAYYNEDELVGGKCPNHPTKTPVWTSEKNYYFRLSKYQGFLLDLYKERPDFVQPEKWASYVRGLVEAGLNDIPVTRANVKWGVQVPFDPEQTIYVWFDALPNYLSYLHFEKHAGQNYYEKFWPVVNHLVGKDIIKFHAILWPAMLKSAGYPVPQHVLVHGFFTVNGQKIGKSNNNAIDPRELVAKYGVDPVRYALLSEFAVGNDGDFSFERLETKYNSELANNWGNLLNRVIHLANNKEIKFDLDNVSKAFKQVVDERVAKYEKFIENFQLFEAIQEVTQLVDFGNKYITDHKPWEKERSIESVTEVLTNLAYLLGKVNDLYEPILPDSVGRAREALAKQETIILFPKLDGK